MTTHLRLTAFICGSLYFLSTQATAAELNFRTQEIATDLKVGYAVNLVDVNGDKKLDIAVVDANRVVWYENPTWAVHTIIKDQTRLDNVCFAAHDIDGDGKLDFALGADWKPFNTAAGGTIQWLRQGASPNEPWELRMIAEEPTTHRMRFIDVDGDGKLELVVVPLMGRNTTKPNFSEHGVRVLAFKIPADPKRDRWPFEVLNDEMHVTHNFVPTDLDRDGKLEILCTSFEGVNLLKRESAGAWSRKVIGAGNQVTSPNRGASEIKRGLLDKGNDYIATIEPWHGDQVVTYTRPTSADGLWRRQVIDEDLKWGHAVTCIDLDGDQDEELVIGIRDNKNDQWKSGVRVYDPQGSAGMQWNRQLIDVGGVAVEDLAAGDLDGDGKADIVAVGRATHNVRIYWNEGKK